MVARGRCPYHGTPGDEYNKSPCRVASWVLSFSNLGLPSRHRDLYTHDQAPWAQRHIWTLPTLCRVTHSEPGLPMREVGILLVDSWYRNQDKLRPDGPLGSYTDFAFIFYWVHYTSIILKFDSHTHSPKNLTFLDLFKILFSLSSLALSLIVSFNTLSILSCTTRTVAGRSLYKSQRSGTSKNKRLVDL